MSRKLRDRGSQHRPWERSSDKGRKVGTKAPRETILIVCEGKKTEPKYFEAFPVKKEVIVHIKGEGKNTKSLVQRAIELAEEGYKEKPYNQVWCVFDKDSFSAKNFNDAITLARNNNINVAYSNEAFELWYLLHFDYHTSALSRTQYQDMLTERLGTKYKKNDTEMYEKLRGKQDTAIRNAEKLINEHIKIKGNHDPARDNPCTTVHKLVKVLNDFIDDD